MMFCACALKDNVKSVYVINSYGKISLTSKKSSTVLNKVSL